jgi:hypothetical protein
MSLTILAFPHGDSKGEESVREDLRRLDFAGGILIEPAMRLPCFPVAMLLGSVHSCSANRFPRSVSKTLYLSQLGTVASVHCLWEVRPGRHKVAGNNIHIMTGCCRCRQDLNRSGCNTWGVMRTRLGGRSRSWYVLRGHTLALGYGCHGCWGRTDVGSQLGAGLLTYLRAHPGNVRRANLRANQGAVPPPFIMSLMALAARPLIPRIRYRVGPDCPEWWGLARWSPE